MKLVRPGLLLLVSALLLCPASAQGLEGRTLEEIQIDGLKRTREDLVRRQLLSRVGDPFHQENLLEDRRRLDRLAVFSNVEFFPHQTATGVRLVVEVSETFPFLPYPAINVTDENGFSIGAGVKALNLLGRGVKLSAAVRFGKDTTNVEVSSESARLANQHWWYRTEFFQRDRPNELVMFQETATELEVFHVGRQLNETLRVGAVFSFLSLGSDRSGVTLSSSNRDNTAGLGMVFEYDTRDLVSNPREGWWNSVDLQKQGGGFLGDGDFVTVNIDVRRFQPINDRHGLALFSLLSLQSGIVNRDLPVYRQYFLGGTNSVRGWDLDARVGPKQWITTVEYRYELLFPFGLSQFSASASLVAFSWRPSVTSAPPRDGKGEFTKNFIGGGGVGLRVIMPFLQMIRFDFAWGQADQGTVFALGFREKAVEQRRRVR